MSITPQSVRIFALPWKGIRLVSGAFSQGTHFTFFYAFYMKHIIFGIGKVSQKRKLNKMNEVEPRGQKSKVITMETSMLVRGVWGLQYRSILIIQK